MGHAEDTSAGFSRRTLLRRSAVVGGTLAWTAPAVQAFAPAAFAGSSDCRLVVCYNGTPVAACYEPPECCECIAAGEDNCDDHCSFSNCESPQPGDSCA